MAISASERQKSGQGLGNFSEFEERIALLGLGGLGVLKPLFYWDVGFHDCWIEGDTAMLKLEEQIHSALFPNSQYLWPDFCAANGVDPDTVQPTKWQNNKCDVLALWSHIHAARDVFVTEDGNFHKKKAALIALGAGRIERAADAAALL